MTKSLLVVIFILGFLGSLYLEPAFAPSSDYISGSEPDGFRGITWEINIADVQDQFIDTGKIDQSFGGIKLYTRKNDEMTIGGSNLDKILYSFWQGKFFAVKISVTGPSNFSALRDACFTNFGKGYHSSVAVTKRNEKLNEKKKIEGGQS